MSIWESTFPQQRPIHPNMVIQWFNNSPWMWCGNWPREIFASHETLPGKNCYWQQEKNSNHHQAQTTTIQLVTSSKGKKFDNLIDS